MGDHIVACSIVDCEKRARNRGWCSAHYERWRRHGDPNHYHWTATLWDRFWPKVDASGDCWVWTASANQFGYGHILTEGRTRGMAHRVAYELLIGPIPEGLELDHLCRNPPCVNPDHLEPVTHAENMARAPWTAVQARRAQTHCKRGHEFTEDNIYRRPGGVGRSCRTCRASRRVAVAG
jgi:hypothetical protein